MEKEYTQTRQAVVVLQGSQEITEAEVDILRLPDGRVGARWAGLVFPLINGQTIDIEQIGLPPGQCLPIAEASPIWSLSAEIEGVGAYIFVNGPASVYLDIRRQLGKGGFRILRSGPNLSGESGDWFIRIEAEQDGLHAILETLLGRNVNPPRPEAGVDLRERILATALYNSQATQSKLKEELERARRQIESITPIEEPPPALQSELNAALQRLAELEAELGGIQGNVSNQPPQPGKPAKLEQEFKAIVDTLLPRITLLWNSLRFIAVELQDRSTIWQILATIERSDRGRLPGWKDLQGHTGWWERHFSNGQDNQGRIYARLNHETRRWMVLVSHKQEQKSDLRRIAGL